MTLPLFPTILLSVLAYALGNPNGAIIVSKAFYQEDVRKKGSGNGGLTNFMRCYGKKAAPLVILVDAGKAVLAVSLGALLFKSSNQVLLGKAIGLFFVVCGHTFPVLYRFHGGKGVLASFAGVMMLNWKMGLILFGLFLLVLLLSRYVSLGSVLSACSVPLVAQLLIGVPAVTLLCAATGALVIFMHRSNIRRLLQGKENKFSVKT